VGQSVLSASQRDDLRVQAQHHALYDSIEHWTGLDGNQAHSKIDAGQRWIEAVGAARDSLVLVGDTLHDLEVAQALDVRCLLVAGGHHSEARLAASGNRVCRGLAEVLTAILEA